MDPDSTTITSNAKLTANFKNGAYTLTFANDGHGKVYSDSSCTSEVTTPVDVEGNSTVAVTADTDQAKATITITKTDTTSTNYYIKAVLLQVVK